MRKVLLIILTAVSLLYVSCENITDVENINENEFGLLTVVIGQPGYFKGTDAIAYSLSNDDRIEFDDTVMISDSSGVLQIAINNLRIGNWNLKTFALSNNDTLYSEEISFVIDKDIKKKVILNWGNQAGKAAWFDGNFSFLEVRNSESINSLKDEFTFESWIKPKTKEYNTLFSKGSTNFLIQLVNYMHPAFLVRGIEFSYSNAYSYWGRLVLNNTIKENTWHHIAVTYDDIITVYINGLVVYQNYANGTVEMGNNNLRIGRRVSDTYPENFSGLMDNIRLWDNCRTQSEILENMKTSILPEEDGLLCNFTFDEVLNDSLLSDKSQYKNHAILKGNLKLLDSYAY